MCTWVRKGTALRRAAPRGLRRLGWLSRGLALAGPLLSMGQAAADKAEWLARDYHQVAAQLKAPELDRGWPRVVAIRGGWVVVRGGQPLHRGQRFRLHSHRPIRTFEPDGSPGGVPSGEERGEFEVQRSEGLEGSGLLPRGTVAELGDVAEPLEPRRLEDDLWWPRRWPGVTRVYGMLRPALTFNEAGFGLLTEIAVEHHFRSPLKLGLAVGPFGVVTAQQGGQQTDVDAEIKTLWAYSTRWFEIGVNPGLRVQNQRSDVLFLLSFSLRVGSLDGLNLLFENSYALGSAGGTLRPLFSSAVGGVNLPMTRAYTLTLTAGATPGLPGTTGWGFATAGVRYYMRGQGGPGTIILRADVGGAWRVEPSTGGITVGYGVEARF